jgi:1-acyl-sn-glycerol-3-phosphate acyltransferase
VQPFYFVAGVLSFPVVRGLFRLGVRGLENLPTGGYVIAPNHASNFDPWPLGMPLWPRRQLRFMAKAELFNPPLAPFLRAAGAFRVRRGEGDEEAIATAVRLARAGEAVVIFPEGTRRVKGLVKKHQPRPHTGAARVALDANVPLIPAAIAGTDRLLKLGPLRVAYGRPIPLEDLGNLDRRKAAGIATERLMEQIERLLETL